MCFEFDPPAVLPSWYRLMAPVLHLEYAARRALRRQDRQIKRQRQMISQQLPGVAIFLPHDVYDDSDIDSEDEDCDDDEEDLDEEDDDEEDRDEEDDEDDEDDDEEDLDEEDDEVGGEGAEIDHDQ